MRQSARNARPLQQIRRIQHGCYLPHGGSTNRDDASGYPRLRLGVPARTVSEDNPPKTGDRDELPIGAWARHHGGRLVQRVFCRDFVDIIQRHGAIRLDDVLDGLVLAPLQPSAADGK